MRSASLSLGKIRVTDPFWSRWQKVVSESSLPHQYHQMIETGRIENFRRVARKESGGHQGYYYNDSDVYKWLESAGYALAAHPNDTLKKQAEDVLQAIIAAQDEDGYLGTFFQLNHPDRKFQNLVAMHELYCGGHLIEAGVGYHEATGDRRLLDVAIKFADLVDRTFGPGKRKGYCGHQELELALIRLGHHLGEPRYVELGKWMVEVRGTDPSPFKEQIEDDEVQKISPWMRNHVCVDGKYDGQYLQDHAPLREHTAVVGHAVRAMYLYTAAAQVLDDEPAQTTLRNLWDSMVNKRMYVTAGIGPNPKNEGFSVDYDLPNATSYAETCAACGLAWWGQKMLEATGDSSFADVVERALYNGALAGLSVSGDRFFYDNPMESDGTHKRVPYFPCACCPPNITRLIGRVAHHFVTANEDTLWLHIPAGFEASLTLGGVETKVTVTSKYPHDGKVTLRIDPAQPADFELRVRIPGWADDVNFDVKSEDSREAEFEQGYACIRRTWNPGDVVELDFEMQAKWLEANPRVTANLGRVCLTRGPLVYCLEEKDAGFVPHRFSVDLGGAVEEAPGYEGSVALKALGFREADDFPDELYAEADSGALEEATAAFIPYHLWNNRGPNAMQVWVRRA